ncbi:MAG: LysR substrate-binding domain-containing protein [Alphaproteobacteria bacterium]|nr:LysR substrate-binding domain-containing protein [Alphaproteobacteria bacterium]
MRKNWHSLREYEALRAMITAGTTTAAARQLSVSQSAISRAIASLEARNGHLLFVRESGRLEPTAEALRLNEAIDPILAALAEIDGQDASAEPRDRLKIVAPTTIAHNFLQAKLDSFLSMQPNIFVSLEVCASDALVAGIAEERFDIGVTDHMVQHFAVRRVPFRQSALVCVMPEGCDLSAKDRVTAQDLANRDLVALTKRHIVRTKADQLLASAGAAPRIKIETATAVSALDFVRRGAGVALLNPFPVLSGNAEGVQVRPFLPSVSFQTSFLTPRGKAVSAIARSFMRHTRQVTVQDPWSEPI